MSVLKACLDNMIVCGRMTALRNVDSAARRGEVEIVTSRESWREQERTRDQNLRSQFERDRPNVPVVSDDHRVLGFQSQYDNLGRWFGASPLVTDVVDDALMAQLKKSGLMDADARHLMYAVHNGCDRFVTTDPHFLDRRVALDELCRGLRIVRTSELAAELASGGYSTAAHPAERKRPSRGFARHVRRRKAEQRALGKLSAQR